MPVPSLGELVAFARQRSPYYQHLYEDLPHGVDEPTALPVVDHAAFWAANTLRDNRVLTGPLTDASVFKTGGTTGAPKFSCYTRAEWRDFVTAYGRGMTAAGLRPDHRVVNAFYAGELYSSFLFTHMSLEQAPVTNVRLPVGGSASPEYTAAVIEDFGAHVLATLPTKLCGLADHLLAQGRTLPGLELLLFAGEAFFEDQRALLAQAFPNARVQSLGCASVDAGLLGEPVAGDDPLLHRPYHPETIVEILDEDTGEPITEPGRAGKLVVTALTRRLMPVIRYPVGDRAAWSERADGSFRLAGRSGEGARVSGVTLYTADVRQIIAACDTEGRVTGVQLVARRREGRDLLTLRLATARRESGAAALGRAITAGIRAARPEYDQFVAAGQLHPLEVEWCAHRDLAVNARSGKLIGVVDERVAS
ncbi:MULTISPECIES: phenylacetate--CoA ligase family protein [Streptomyces]|uniref:phenylacetate--CoA ligase family protein n=1 Tax=Streptomyces TaxID=1883 RepID=UPI0013DAE7E4|nr:AMP-binding protein [Streptomyces aureoverticillatus]QIB45408.1 phenylacetate--CoA ligase [Streptomyces aureoverticillatus]